MKKNLTLTLTLIGLISFTNIYSQTDTKIARIDSMIEIYTDYYGFCGTVLVEKSGDIIFNKGYGYASYELNMPCTDSTLYHIGSITKGFARVLIDGLINEGKLNLNDKLIKYLPEIGEEKGNKILIKHLIVHQSGLQEKFFEQSRATRLDNIRSIKDTELQFEPGTKEEYCNLNYYILGIICERLTGYDIASGFREKIFKPLGMNDSYLDDAERMLKNMSVPHYINQVNQPDMFIHVFPYCSGRGFAQGGAIMTSADLLKWIHGWHSNKFKLKVEELDNENSNIHGKGYDQFSMGWETNGKKRRYAQGDGIGEGTRAMYIYFPDDSITILYVNNSYFFPAEYNSKWNYILFDDIVHNSAKIMLEKEYSSPKLPVGQILINDLNAGKSLDEIIATYMKLKEVDSEYLIDVKQLNRIAYVLMEQDKMADAFKILELNMQEYPDHWITADGMAEYYLRNGERENAIKYLKISLEKNPNQWREQRKMNDIRRNNLETLDWKN